MLCSVSGTTRCSSQTHVVFCFRDYPLFESDLYCVVFSGTTRCSSQTHVCFLFVLFLTLSERKLYLHVGVKDDIVASARQNINGDQRHSRLMGNIFN